MSLNCQIHFQKRFDYMQGRAAPQSQLTERQPRGRELELGAETSIPQDGILSLLLVPCKSQSKPLQTAGSLCKTGS